MKKVWSILCVCAMVVGMLPMMTLPASAAIEGDYTYNVSNDKATIIGYFGSDADVTIPSKLDGYTVVSIGNEAFENCVQIKNLTIPNMRYTHHRGLAAVTRWVKLKYAAMNLKKLAIWSWNNSVFSAFSSLIFLKYNETPAFA